MRKSRGSRRVQLVQPAFERFEVAQRGKVRDVAAVEKNMDARPGDPIAARSFEQGKEVGHARMHTAVGEQADQMQRRVVGDHLGDQPAPVTFPDLPRSDRLVDLVRSLVEYSSGAERVVADFGVAHVAVGAESYGATMCAKRADRSGPLKAVEYRSGSRGHRVVLIA